LSDGAFTLPFELCNGLLMRCPQDADSAGGQPAMQVADRQHGDGLTWRHAGPAPIATTRSASMTSGASPRPPAMNKYGRLAICQPADVSARQVAGDPGERPDAVVHGAGGAGGGRDRGAATRCHLLLLTQLPLRGPDRQADHCRRPLRRIRDSSMESRILVMPFCCGSGSPTARWARPRLPLTSSAPVRFSPADEGSRLVEGGELFDLVQSRRIELAYAHDPNFAVSLLRRANTSSPAPEASGGGLARRVARAAVGDVSRPPGAASRSVSVLP